MVQKTNEFHKIFNFLKEKKQIIYFGLYYLISLFYLYFIGLGNMYKIGFFVLINLLFYLFSNKRQFKF